MALRHLAHILPPSAHHGNPDGSEILFINSIRGVGISAVQTTVTELHPKPYFMRVRAAFLAARDREAGDRFAAARRAWRDKASFEAALRPSRFSARRVARERFADFFLVPALRMSRSA